MEQDSQITLTSNQAIASVMKHYGAIKETFPHAELQCERRWATWEAVYIAQAAAGTNADQCVETAEFENVKRLGPKIIPFVVFKLAKDDDGQNCYGVFLYNALENDAEYRVTTSVSEDESLTSMKTLQHLSTKVVELNYQRNIVFEERVSAWIAYHQENWLQSSSFCFTLCEKYWDLLEMGTGIIAPLMVEYERLRWGYWFQLLHEIIHGRQLGAYSYQKGVLYEKCVSWFNEGEHSEAPLYIPTELDRYLLAGVQAMQNSAAGQ